MQNGVLFSSIRPLAQKSLGIEFCIFKILNNINYMPTCTCIFPFYAGDIWPAVITSYYFFYFYCLPYFVSMVIFSLLSTDTAISEDFDDLRVP